MDTTAMGSVTAAIEGVLKGDPAAMEKLWESYYRRLLELLRKRSRPMRPPVLEDEEDVAVSAMNSIFEGVMRGQFPRLDDRDNLTLLDGIAFLDGDLDDNTVHRRGHFISGLRDPALFVRTPRWLGFVMVRYRTTPRHRGNIN